MGFTHVFLIQFCKYFQFSCPNKGFSFVEIEFFFCGQKENKNKNKNKNKMALDRNVGLRVNAYVLGIFGLGALIFPHLLLFLSHNASDDLQREVHAVLRGLLFVIVSFWC